MNFLKLVNNCKTSGYEDICKYASSSEIPEIDEEDAAPVTKFLFSMNGEEIVEKIKLYTNLDLNPDLVNLINNSALNARRLWHVLSECCINAGLENLKVSDYLTFKIIFCDLFSISKIENQSEMVILCVLYFFVDKYLDSPKLSVDDKKSFSNWINQVFRELADGSCVYPDTNGCEMCDYILQIFNTEASKNCRSGFWKGLLHLSLAQIASSKMTPESSFEELTQTSENKAFETMSILFHMAENKRVDANRDFLKITGFGQFLDDMFDIEDDLNDGSETLPVRVYRDKDWEQLRNYTDELIHIYIRFFCNGGASSLTFLKEDVKNKVSKLFLDLFSSEENVDTFVNIFSEFSAALVAAKGNILRIPVTTCIPLFEMFYIFIKSKSDILNNLQKELF